MLETACRGDIEARGYDALLEWISNWTENLWRAQIARLEGGTDRSRGG
jgi:hypothetical protein